ncbi:MAG: hypothetical protein BWY83_03209 [bacterium ADurb.Bin478]|jgi:hypothetical protein|nr:MAG: hypothetical protein BWY83_03209 [bacterium ADurb.Bin478]
MVSVTPKAKKAFKDLAAKEGVGGRIYRIITAGYG